MKWIVLAILLFVAGYTFVTLRFRKPGPAHQPYQDARERATAARLTDAGYRRVAVEIERPAEPQHARASLGRQLATVADAPAGLPEELAITFIDAPRLPERFSDVAAPQTATPMLPYPLVYTCVLPDNKEVIGETRVYVKNGHVAIVTDFDRLDGELVSRTKEAALLLQIPAGTFEAGKTYELSLVGREQSKRWTVQVH